MKMPFEGKTGHLPPEDCRQTSLGALTSSLFPDQKGYATLLRTLAILGELSRVAPEISGAT